MRLDHPIFHQPLEPSIELAEIATPSNYPNWPDGRALGPTMKVWKVHDGEFPTIDVGLVCDPYGFEDTPDAEWISSGVNSKGPSSVALGRVGNFFQWGFFGDPSLMTESARQVFVNTICWMKRFDGQRPLLRSKQAQSRDWALVYVGYVRELGDSTTKFTSHSAEGTKEQSAQEFLRTLFPAEMLAAAGQGEGKLDADRLEKHYLENLEYLTQGPQALIVDEDVRELQVSNRKMELLTTLASRLESDPEDALARRCVARYLRPPVSGGAAIAHWLRERADRMYFSDVAGFRWFETPVGMPARSAVVFPHEPSRNEPVVAVATVDPGSVAKGGAFTLTVHVRTAPTWHVYPQDSTGTPNVRTSLALELPEGIEAVGEWEQPKSSRDLRSGVPILEGSFAFRQQLRVQPGARPGSCELVCAIDYQCCDPFACRPPERLVVRATMWVGE